MTRSPKSRALLATLRALVMSPDTLPTPGDYAPLYARLTPSARASVYSDDATPPTVRSGAARGLYGAPDTVSVGVSLAQVDPFYLADCMH